MIRPLCLALCAAALPSIAIAQEIVVTAERRPQSVDRAPASAAALTAEDLARVGPQHPSEALNRLPGVAIHRNNGLESLPAIRSPVLNGGQSAGSFLVLEDGVAIRSPGFGNVNQLFEASLEFADRVELVRGPGSALYGSNAVHGLVNVVTATPGKERRIHFSLSAGAFGRLSAEAVRRGPVILGLALAQEDGWRAQSGFDQQKALLRAAGHVGPWRLDGKIAAQNLNQESAGFIEGADAYRNAVIARSNPTPEGYRDARLVRLQVEASRALGHDLALTVTPYARWIDADLNLSFFPSRAQELTRQTGGGLQAQVYWDPSAALSLIVGADLDQTHATLFQVQRRPNVGTFVQGVQYDYAVDATFAAGFVQASLGLAPNVRLVAGARAEWAGFAYDNQGPVNDLGRFRRVADREDDFAYFTPKLGIVQTFDGGGALWANYARGARAPQASDLYSLQTTQVAGGQSAETIDSFEIGLRRPMFGRGLIELSAYRMDKRDTAFRNALGFTVTDGRTRHQGIEIAGFAPLGASAELSGWATWARHTYRFDNPAGPASEQIEIGDDVDSAPEWIANVRLTVRPARRLETELEWVHMGAYFTDAGNTRSYPGHDVFHLRAFFELSRSVRLGVAVRNLFDEDYAERADFAFGADRYFPGEPRAVTVTLAGRS